MSIFSLFFQTLISKEVKVFEFTEKLIETLKIRKVKKKTTYTLGDYCVCFSRQYAMTYAMTLLRSKKY